MINPGYLFKVSVVRRLYTTLATIIHATLNHLILRHLRAFEDLYQ